VATGIANLWARDALAVVGAQQLLCEAHPGRFLLGVGVSHKPVARRRGGDFADKAPLSRLRDYLEAMESAPYHAVPSAGERPVVIAALGPKMLELARERTDGAHTCNSPPEHTAWARTILGDDRPAEWAEQDELALHCRRPDAFLETIGVRP
jgi:probable F420-dependent oxidoreductase